MCVRVGYDRVRAENTILVILTAFLRSSSCSHTQAVNKLTGGVEFLLKKNKVDYIKGFGKLKSGHEVRWHPLYR